MTEYHSAKLTPMPTDETWSQAYAAGKLCAVVSLTISEPGEILLSTLGKDILTTLEQEFFTLEEKTLPAIQQAVSLAAEKIPQGVKGTLIVGALQDMILYVYVKGEGKVLILRDGILGTIANETSDTIHAFSGFLEDFDMVFFGTQSFFQTISEKDFTKDTENGVEDLSERIMPILHSSENAADAAAVILSYKTSPEEGFLSEPLPSQTHVASDSIQSLSEESDMADGETHAVTRKRKLPRLPFPIPTSLPYQRFFKKKIVFLLLAFLLVAILGISIVKTYKKQQNASVTAAFEKVYPQAKKDYDEGQSLVTLNKNLANESFLAAKKILTDNQSKFPPGSPEGKQAHDLLTQVNAALGGSTSQAPIQAQEVPLDKSDMLKNENSQTVLAASVDPNDVYLLSTSAITSIDRKSGKSKTLVKNNSDWVEPVGLGAYGSNLYVLDRKNGVIKFIARDNGYGNASYFSKSAQPDLSKAVSLAIDGSVYILTSDGSIAKFTRGTPDTFKLSGVDKSFAGATKLFTNDSFSNLYILDKANGRIVVVGKDGAYKTQYAAAVIKSAIDFEVDESNKAIHILSQGKLYQISMQ